MIRRYFDGILRELFIHPSVASFRILRQETSDEEGYIRVKCVLSNSDVLEFSEYVEVKDDVVHIITYNYHWQALRGLLVKRWDNVEHHKKVKTFPHHLHLADERVVDSSPMDLIKVLQDIEKKTAE